MRIPIRPVLWLMPFLLCLGINPRAVAAASTPDSQATVAAQTAPAAASTPAAVTAPIAGIITNIADDQSSIRIVDGTGEAHTAAIVANGAVSKSQLAAYQRGDAVLIQTIPGANDTTVLSDIEPQSIAISRGMRVLVLAGAGAVIVAIALFLSCNFGLQLLIGEDKRYSNSKFQLLLWFSAVIASYIAIFALRIRYAGTDFIGGISIPQNLAVLSGISAFTLGAAKGITVNAVAKARDRATAAALAVATAPGAAAALAAAAIPAPIANPKGVGTPSFVNDLTHNDKGDADVGDFQQVVVTLVAVSAYLIAVFHYLGTVTMQHSIWLPDVDSTVLAVFGLGHGAYLTKKYASPAGDG